MFFATSASIRSDWLRFRVRPGLSVRREVIPHHLVQYHKASACPISCYCVVAVHRYHSRLLIACCLLLPVLVPLLLPLALRTVTNLVFQ